MTGLRGFGQVLSCTLSTLLLNFHQVQLTYFPVVVNSTQLDIFSSQPENLFMTKLTSTLSFAAQAGSEIDLWTPAETGDWATDNATGRAYALELIGVMKANEAPILLGHVAKAIGARGKHGGVEVGFFQQIAEKLLLV
ncbi:hypothetical protein [Rhizobium brockwellii]